MAQSYTEQTAAVAVRYLRISDDKAADEHGIQTQDEVTGKLVAERGYVPATAHGPGDQPGVFSDNDISAYTDKHNRAGYEAMLEAAQRGEFSVIVVRHLDRLWANREALARGIAILGKAGVSVACVKGQDIDLSNAQGQLMCDILGAVGQYERAIKGERGESAQRAAAAKGLHVGGARVFGWDLVPDPARADSPNVAHRMAAVKPVVNAREAREIIRAAEGVVAGRTMMSLASEMNAAGWRTSREGTTRKDGTARSGEWDGGTLRNLLMRERNFGRVIFNGEVFDGVWPALQYIDDSGTTHVFDEALHLKVKAKLTEQPASNAAWIGAGRPVLHLLSGIARCGRCDAKLTAGKGSTYKCPASHVRRPQEVLDHVVTEWVLTRLEHMPLAQRATLLGNDAPSGPDAEEAANLRRQISTVQDGLLDGTFTKPEAKTRLATLRAKLTAAEKRMATVTRQPVLAAVVAADDPRKGWEALPLDRKRAVIRELVTVKVMPGERGVALSKGGPETWTTAGIRASITWKLAGYDFDLSEVDSAFFAVPEHE